MFESDTKTEEKIKIASLTRGKKRFSLVSFHVKSVFFFLVCSLFLCCATYSE